MKHKNGKRKYANGVPIIRSTKEMGRMNAVIKSISTARLGKYLSAPAWAIIAHSFAWSTWDECLYRNGSRAIGTALGLERRQVRRGLAELIALGIFTPQARAPDASPREAPAYTVNAPKRSGDGRLQLVTGEVAPTKHSGRTPRTGGKNGGAGVSRSKKSKPKSVAVIAKEMQEKEAVLAEQNHKQARQMQIQTYAEKLRKAIEIPRCQESRSTIFFINDFYKDDRKPTILEESRWYDDQPWRDELITKAKEKMKLLQQEIEGKP